MNELQTQIMDALRELGGETSWIEWVNVLMAMAPETNANSAYSSIEEMERDNLIWTRTLTRKIRHQPQSQTTLQLKIREQTSD